MARKAVDLAKQKEARQKKMLLFLAPVFLALLVWQGPKTYTALTGGSSAAPPAPAAVSTTPAPGAAQPNGAGPAIPTAPAAGLPDTDQPLEPLDGQLISFSRFGGRDPFDQTYAPEAAAGANAGGTTGTDDGAATANTAEVEVNGAVETVRVGDAFPANDPAFRLVSISGQTATVGLVSGSFSTGADTITIDVGETLVLMSDPDGTRYAIKLVSVANVAP